MMLGPAGNGVGSTSAHGNTGSGERKVRRMKCQGSA
jgi:hypothetical protein